MSEAPERPVARYVVLYDGRMWQINLVGKNYGPYATRDGAIRDAIETARKARQSGYEAIVLSRGADGGFKTEWSGED